MPKLDDLEFEFKEIADERVVDYLGKIGQAIAKVYNSIPKPVELPKLFNIQGKVELTKSPPIQIRNFDELGKYFDRMNQRIEALALAIHNMPPAQVNIPKIEIPKIELPKLKSENNVRLEALIEAFNKKIDTISAPSSPASMRKTEELLAALVERPQMTPQPVTNIWLNPSQGFLKTTDNTVGTTLTTLPQYGQLFNRRSVLIYNNSANTIYIGGSDLTTGNGLPVPSSAYAPPVDAGYNLPIYAVASQNGNDVRVIEISKDKSGSIQE